MAKHAREKIINAAFYLFLLKGYNGVSLKDIKQITKLSQGAIYHHFDSKYAIYLATVETYFFQLLQHAASSSDEEKLDFRARMRLHYGFMARLFSEIQKIGDGIDFPIRAYFLFQLESEKDDDLREKIVDAVTTFRQETISMVQAAIDKGEIKVNLSAKTIAYQIIGLTEGMAIHHSAVEKAGETFLMKKYDEIIIPYLDLICGKVNHKL